MPIYRYQCNKCEQVTEAIQKMSDPPLTNCDDPECSGKLKKMLTTAAAHFKGEGWYSDGYATTETAKSRARDAAARQQGSGKTKSGMSTNVKDIQAGLEKAAREGTAKGGEAGGMNAAHSYLNKLEGKE